MGLLGDILKRTEQIIKSETNSLVNKIENKAAGTAAKEVNDTIKNYHLTTRTFTYDSLPVTLDELKDLLEYGVTKNEVTLIDDKGSLSKAYLRLSDDRKRIVADYNK